MTDIDKDATVDAASLPAQLLRVGALATFETSKCMVILRRDSEQLSEVRNHPFDESQDDITPTLPLGLSEDRGGAGTESWLALPNGGLLIPGTAEGFLPSTRRRIRILTLVCVWGLFFRGDGDLAAAAAHSTGLLNRSSSRVKVGGGSLIETSQIRRPIWERSDRSCRS
jgi:hypothetical protein